jgi:hypothetical protein
MEQANRDSCVGIFKGRASSLSRLSLTRKWTGTIRKVTRSQEPKRRCWSRSHASVSPCPEEDRRWAVAREQGKAKDWRVRILTCQDVHASSSLAMNGRIRVETANFIVSDRGGAYTDLF